VSPKKKNTHYPRCNKYKSRRVYLIIQLFDILQDQVNMTLLDFNFKLLTAKNIDSEIKICMVSDAQQRAKKSQKQYPEKRCKLSSGCLDFFPP